MSAPLLAVSTTEGHLEFVDTQTLETVGRLDGLLAQPHELAWDPNRRLLYLTHTYRSGGYGGGQEAGHEVSVIDPDTYRVADVIDTLPYLAPHDVEFDPARDLIYLSIEDREGHNGLVVIDAASRTVVDNIPLPEPNTHWIALTPDGRTCFAAHKEAKSITVVDLDSRTVVGSIATRGGTEEIDCSQDGRFAYVATPLMAVVGNITQGVLNRKPAGPDDPAPAVLKIDIQTREIVGSLELDEVICALRVTPGGDLLISEMHFPDPDDAVPAPTPGRVLVVDTSTMSVKTSYEAGEQPFTIRCSPDGATAYVANLKSGTVTVIDLARQEVVATLNHHVGTAFGGTHGLCWVPSATPPGDLT